METTGLELLDRTARSGSRFEVQKGKWFRYPGVCILKRGGGCWERGRDVGSVRFMAGRRSDT